MRLRDGLYSKWPDELPGNEAKRKRSGLGGAKFPLFYGGIPVNGLLKLSSLIDGLTERVGKAIIWLVLVVTLIGAGNAVMRYIWNYSSNAFLEIQWYLFSAIFLFGAGYTLMRNEHVRIDLISGRLSPRGRAWIDIFGIIFFLLPMATAIMYLSWPIFLLALANNEQSSNAGGLTVWPVRLLVPIGFFLLVIQGISELIKRFGFLQGRCPDPTAKGHKPTPEEELALAIKAQKGEL
jgi:TRAP-type mannitol/chloroaromatic compound transport system permease small subunit